METKPKEKLFFIPHYLGSLRYFEKLVPYLSEKYDVIFLLLEIKKERDYAEDMSNYCQDHGYKFFTIKIPEFKKSFELIDLFKNLRYFKRETDKIIVQEQNIKKIVSMNDNSAYLRYLLQRANVLGIDTMVLQWALTFEGQEVKPKRSVNFLRKIIYSFVKPLKSFFTRLVMKLVFGWNFNFKKEVLGGGVSKRFGVINEQAKKYFVERGVAPKKISVVGYMDFYLAESTKRELDNNSLKRSDIARSLGIAENKKLITIYSGAYNKKDISIFSNEEQYKFYENIVLSIKKYCKEDAFDVCVKIHPAEDIRIYEPLKKYGVKLFDKFTDNFHLIYFSDLYISDCSTTNFIPIIMGKEIIFINLMNLEVVELSKPHYGIKEFTHSFEEFEDKIEAFQKGVLKKQYVYDEDIFTKNSLEKIVKWIG